MLSTDFDSLQCRGFGSPEATLWTARGLNRNPALDLGPLPPDGPSSAAKEVALRDLGAAATEGAAALARRRPVRSTAGSSKSKRERG
jgi:hypothetical protein